MALSQYRLLYRVISRGVGNPVDRNFVNWQHLRDPIHWLTFAYLSVISSTSQLESASNHCLPRSNNVKQGIHPVDMCKTSHNRLKLGERNACSKRLNRKIPKPTPDLWTTHKIPPPYFINTAPNDDVNEPYSRVDPTSAVSTRPVFDNRRKKGVSSWWMPIYPFVCVVTHHPTYDHPWDTIAQLNKFIHLPLQ